MPRIFNLVRAIDPISDFAKYLKKIVCDHKASAKRRCSATLVIRLEMESMNP